MDENGGKQGRGRVRMGEIQRESRSAGSHVLPSRRRLPLIDRAFLPPLQSEERAKRSLPNERDPRPRSIRKLLGKRKNVRRVVIVH